VTWIPLLWTWLHEVPSANLDDYSPSTLRQFDAAMRERLTHERSWGVLLAGLPVGAIGYLPMTARLGVFHGICFTQTACGIGVARIAVCQVLDELFDAGVEKVCAYFFADNRRVQRLFEKLGGDDEGLQRAQTLRRGQPVDLRLMALFNPRVQRKEA